MTIFLLLCNNVDKRYKTSRAVLVTSISNTAREHGRHILAPVFTGRAHGPWTRRHFGHLCPRPVNTARGHG